MYKDAVMGPSIYDFSFSRLSIQPRVKEITPDWDYFFTADKVHMYRQTGYYVIYYD